jgi:hypothetical protein
MALRSGVLCKMARTQWARGFARVWTHAVGLDNPNFSPQELIASFSFLIFPIKKEKDLVQANPHRSHWEGNCNILFVILLDIPLTQGEPISDMGGQGNTAVIVDTSQVILAQSDSLKYQWLLDSGSTFSCASEFLCLSSSFLTFPFKHHENPDPYHLNHYTHLFVSMLCDPGPVVTVTVRTDLCGNLRCKTGC